MSEQNRQESWHLSKGVPVALIVALFVQTVSVVWWAASIDNRVANLERTSVDGERVVRVEERVLAIKDAVERVERMLATIVASVEPASGSTESGG